MLTRGSCPTKKRELCCASRALNKQRGWGLMIFCARATRGRSSTQLGTLSLSKGGLPSPGLMACLDVPVGGRVRKLRAVEDQSAPSPER